MTLLQLYMHVLTFLLSYLGTQAAGQNGPAGSTLSQQLSQLASLVLAQGKRDRCSSGAAGLVGIWCTCPLTLEVEQTHLFQGLALRTDIPEAV